MPESSEVFFCIDPEDEEFAEIIKNARKKLEVQAVLAMRCTRTKKPERGDLCPKIHKTAYGRKSSFRIIGGHLSSEDCCIRQGTLEVQRSSCTSWWHCERRFRLLCRVHRTRFISITSDGSKKSWMSFKATRLRRTSSGRSICLHSSQVGDAPKMLKIPKSECPDIWIRLPRHKMAKSWSIKEKPSRSSVVDWSTVGKVKN